MLTMSLVIKCVPICPQPAEEVSSVIKSCKLGEKPAVAMQCLNDVLRIKI